MIRVARRDHPGFGFDVADLRELPFGDASLAGLVCWYSLMFLAPAGVPAAIVNRMAAETAKAVASPGIKSRCTRFFTIFSSGTVTKTSRGHRSSGGLASQNSLPGMSTLSRSYPVTARQNSATR